MGEASAVGGGAFRAKGAAEAKMWTSRTGTEARLGSKPERVPMIQPELF